MQPGRQKYQRNTQSITSVRRAVIVWGIILIFAILLVRLWYSQSMRTETPSYTEFYQSLTSKKISSVVLMGRKIKGTYISSFNDGKHFTLIVPTNDPDLFDALRSNVADFRVKYSGMIFSNIILFVMMITLFFVAMRFFYITSGCGCIGKFVGIW